MGPVPFRSGPCREWKWAGRVASEASFLIVHRAPGAGLAREDRKDRGQHSWTSVVVAREGTVRAGRWPETGELVSSCLPPSPSGSAGVWAWG